MVVSSYKVICKNELCECEVDLRDLPSGYCKKCKDAYDKGYKAGWNKKNGWW